jgi:lycopene beta-cyclase
VPAIKERIQAYAAAKGWTIKRIVREEKGVLPVVLAGDINKFWQRASRDGIPRVGLRASLFHPTTGYSLPDAIAFADRLAASRDLSSVGVAHLVESHSRALWRTRGFFRLLNRLLFIAATPAERVVVMERFYRLPAALIERFFAGKLTPGDKATIFLNRLADEGPPVPLSKAIRALSVAPAWAFARRTQAPIQ